MTTPQSDTAADGASSSERLRDAASEAFRSGRRQLAGILELATLEARYSSLMLAAVLGLAVVVALTVLAAWGLLAAAAIAWLIAAGWSWAAALGLVGLIHVAAGTAALLLLRCCIARIGMDSTREALGLAISCAPE